MVPGIVLAAGASSRMGRTKALLELDGRTFVRRILHTLRDAGLPDVVVVLRPGQPDTAAEIASARFGRVVVNHRPDEGQLSSLIVGLDAIAGPDAPDAADVEGALVTLVDTPLIQAATVRALLTRVSTSRADVLRAAHGGRHGHPVIFTRPVFDALRRADPAVGAKAVLRAAHVENVEVDDPGVLRDVDTPRDYADIQRAPRSQSRAGGEG